MGVDVYTGIPDIMERLKECLGREPDLGDGPVVGFSNIPLDKIPDYLRNSEGLEIREASGAFIHPKEKDIAKRYRLGD